MLQTPGWRALTQGIPAKHRITYISVMYRLFIASIDDFCLLVECTGHLVVTCVSRRLHAGVSHRVHCMT